MLNFLKKEVFMIIKPVKPLVIFWILFFLLLTFNLIFNQDKKDSEEDKYSKHIEELKKKLPNKEFNICIQKPFVVVGDVPLEELKTRWCEKTIKWAVSELKTAYFAKDPENILDIWLFKDEDSYIKHNKLLWDNEPGTPYGYYSSHHKVLVMNISTGGGTLVHEIVHPYMEANFPNCPAWFNEGLGSLYEQSTIKNGKIWGDTNWRLAGLKTSIKKASLPTFEKLMALNSFQFYNPTGASYSGNYAQSRYLLYYLQEKSLLITYYKEFTKNQKDDPTGFKTLKELLKETDMIDFQKRWEAYVLKLTFNGK